MRVGVVIPTFNGACTLAEQLAAVARQGRVDEVVISDNGSTDQSRTVAERFAGSLALRVIDSSSRRGNAAARNLGAAAATGDLFLFLDQDDEVAADWVEMMVGALGSADMVVGANQIVVDWPPCPPYPQSVAAVTDFLPYGLSCNMGIRRETFELLRGFDESYQSATDVDLCWRAQLAGLRFATVPEALVYKRAKRAGRAAFRQHAEFGWDGALLYMRFRDTGMQRSRPMRRYLWLLTRLPLMWRMSVRETWLRLAGDCWGRLKGSLAARARYL